MNTEELDRALRDALERSGDAPPPTGMGPVVVRRVRRQNRVRMSLGVVAVVAVAAVAVPLGLGATGGEPAQLGVAPQDRTRVVSAYSGVDPQGGKSKSLLLDRTTGTYVETPYRSAVPSPDGTRVLVWMGDDTPTSPLRSGILDPATGRVREIDGYTGEGAWSPDGKEILFTVAPRLGDNGFAIVDATTLKSSFAKVDFKADNSTGLDFVWTPGGREVALTLTHAAGDERLSDPVSGIRFYDRAGTLTHTLPATAELTSTSDFSPDGTRIVLYSRTSSDEPAQIVDAATGAVRKRVPLKGRNDILGWADDEHLIVCHWNDQLSRSELRVVDLAGRVAEVVRLRSDAATANAISIGPAEGLPPTAADLVF